MPASMNRHHRRSIRLRNYDYTQCGAYFVTICTEERRCIFGQVVGGEMVVNEWGQIVAEEWEQTAIIRPNVELDAFVVMPNHVHAIIVIADDGRGGRGMDGRGMMHHAPTDAPTEYITPTGTPTPHDPQTAPGGTGVMDDRGITPGGTGRGGRGMDGRGMMHHAPTEYIAPTDTPTPYDPQTTPGGMGVMDDRGITPGGMGRGGRGMMHHAPTNPPTEYIAPTNPPTIREFSKPIPNSLPTIIGAFKAAITRRINRLPNPPDYAIWQRNYYEHIIRNEISLNHIRAYIANNAAKWAVDSLYTE